MSLALCYASIGLAGVWAWGQANENVVTWRHARGWGKSSAMMAMPWYLIPMFASPATSPSIITAVWVVGIAINAALVWLILDAWSRRQAAQRQRSNDR